MLQSPGLKKTGHDLVIGQQQRMMVKALNIGMRKCSDDDEDDDDGEDFSSGKFSSVYFPLFLLLFLSFYSEGYLSKIGFCSVQFRLVQFSCSVLSDSVTPWTEAWQASLSFTNSQSLLKHMSMYSKSYFSKV